MKKFIYIILVLLIYPNFSFSNTWEIIESKDDFKNESFKYVISNEVKPNAPLDFPYEKLNASFFMYCENDTMGGIIFNMNPNLIDGDIEDGYHRYWVDVRLDGEFDNISLFQDFNSKVITIKYDSFIKVKNTDEFLIQLKHYGGTRHYKFNLSNKPDC